MFLRLFGAILQKKTVLSKLFIKNQIKNQNRRYRLVKENLYTNKKRWKWVLAMVALLIVGASLWYTNFLVKSIAEQETNQVKMWAAAMEQHAGMMKSTEEFFGKVSEQEQMRVDLLAHAYRQVLDFSNNENTAIYLEIIKNNISIPLVITDDAGNIMFSNNLRRKRSTPRCARPTPSSSPSKSTRVSDRFSGFTTTSRSSTRS